MHAAPDQSLVSPSRTGTGAVRFTVATLADDAEIRRLLRENPMPGSISISLEREPNAGLAAAIEGDVHHTIVARDERCGRLIAMGSVAVRERYLNGQPTRVGYLGQLRLEHRRRSRGCVIRDGYRFFRKLHESLGVRLYLTSIVADNAPARRLLERGLPDMPTYRPIGEFVTLVFRRRRHRVFGTVGANGCRGSRGRNLAIHHGSPDLMPTIAALLNCEAARGQFAPVFSAPQLTALADHGLHPSHFRVLVERDRAVACAAVWDQRASRQTVVRRYPTAFRLARVSLNLLAPFTRLPTLPPVGTPIAMGLLSHVATPSDWPELIVPLVRSLEGPTLTSEVDCIAAGFDARDPRLGILRRALGGREYRTQLYVVHWDDGRAAAEALDNRLCQPEIALL